MSKERISWLLLTLQHSLFPHLDECLFSPLTEREVSARMFVAKAVLQQGARLHFGRIEI